MKHDDSRLAMKIRGNHRRCRRRLLPLHSDRTPSNSCFLRSCEAASPRAQPAAMSTRRVSTRTSPRIRLCGSLNGIPTE